MSKILKVLIMSLLVTIIMIVAFAGTVFAAGGPNSGDCPNPDCRTEICDYCGESYDMVHEDHICPPRCPECKDFTLKPLKNYQSFMIYKCEKCKKEFGEDEGANPHDRGHQLTSGRSRCLNSTGNISFVAGFFH